MITLSHLYAVFDANWKQIQSWMSKSAKLQGQSKAEADEILGSIFSISEQVSWALPWKSILEIENVVGKMQDSIPDVGNVANEMFRKMEKQIKNPTNLFNQSKEHVQAGVDLLKEAQPKLEKFPELKKSISVLVGISVEVTRSLYVFSQIFERLKADASRPNFPTFLPADESIRDLMGTDVDTDSSKRESEPMINSILDKYTRGEITKEQMNAQMSEFAKKDVYRTITSINKLPF